MHDHHGRGSVRNVVACGQEMMLMGNIDEPDYQQQNSLWAALRGRGTFWGWQPWMYRPTGYWRWGPFSGQLQVSSDERLPGQDGELTTVQPPRRNWRRKQA
jgi:hypothetical protein